jgi:hypothetical protein
MRRVRKLHLYLSVFFAPLLVFYISTGWYQTLRSNRNKLLGEQDTFVSKLTAIHVDSIFPKPEAPGEYKPGLFQAFVVTMSICLLITIGLGIYLAFRSSRIAWPVALALALGILLPVLFLWLGQPR